MTNQHAGLSQVLAEQRITERREQAAHARLVRGARLLCRRHRRRQARGWWHLARWPGVTAEQPARRRPHSPVDRSEVTMSKRARALILGATLAAMNLAGMTAIAQAHVAKHTIMQYASPPLEPRAGESDRHGQAAAPQQTAADAALRRVLARERFSIPSGTPAQVPAPVPAEPSGQRGWLVASLGVLAAALVLIAGLAVLAARRASRRARVGHAA